MNKPRIFLRSSGRQAKLLQAITRGLEDVADVEAQLIAQRLEEWKSAANAF